MLPRSVQSQVAVSVGALVMLVVALAGLTIALRIDHRDRTDVDRQLTARAAKVQQDAAKLVLDGTDTTGGVAHTNDDYGGLLAGSQSLVRLIADGRVIATRGDQPPATIPLPSRDGFATIDVDGQPWRSLVQPLTDGSGARLQVLQSLEPVEERLADGQRIVVAVAVAATIAAAAGVWAISGVVLAPLRRLRTGALRIRPTDLEQRLPVATRPQEVADLSATLNRMLERLQASMLATRRFTADAGHELRTPLTSLGIDLETLLRNPDLPAATRQETLAAMTAEHHRIVTLLEGLQTLARGDAEALPARTSIDITDLVADAVDRARRKHPAVRYRHTEPVRPVVIDGWRTGLTLAVDNLLDNAALHGRADGTVDVRVTTDAPDPAAGVRITVADDGPGIPAEQHEAMKRRFARGEQPRSDGSGLGLALIDQQAHLHGGTLQLGRAVGGGLVATLLLPAAQPPSGTRRRRPPS
ncbi:HAMP domain-containing sensor histidine kinase [Dactylosporangium sp. NPDC005572]|uniref:HAMP domain-containing sensor histidine kinase n=1 Tax=Dactylosporangium sp. NPDC005572 TaxID=3156889 RepID=UPI0033A45769